MRYQKTLSMALALVLCAGGLFGQEIPEITIDLGESASDGWVSRQTEITVVVDSSYDDRLAFLLGSTDLTDLFRRTDRGWVYRATELPLPAGEHTLMVYQVGGEEEWTEWAQFPLRIKSKHGFTERSYSLNADLEAHGRWSDDDTEGSERQEEIEADLQLAGSFRLGRPNGAFEAEIQMVGVSDENRALRAGLDDDPDQLDLASYRLSASFGRGSLELGHTSWGASRYLVDSFSSRGLTGSLRLGSRVAVVGDLGPFCGCRLGGADIHAPVDLHRVDRDDLSTGSRPRQRQRQLRLAGGRRTDDHQGIDRIARHTATTGIRVRRLEGTSRTSQTSPRR